MQKSYSFFKSLRKVRKEYIGDMSNAQREHFAESRQAALSFTTQNFHKTALPPTVGLKADFFSDTLTAMRYETDYDEWVKKRLVFEPMTIRDEIAIIANTSGLLKILYPDLRVSRDAFYNFCVRPAVEMRQIVRNQL